MKKTQVINMLNRKPYRTAQQKLDAKASAELCADGVYRSNAAVSFHTRKQTNVK